MTFFVGSNKAIDRKMDRLPSFTEAELMIYVPQAAAFYEETGILPDRLAEDPYEAKLGEAFLYYAGLRQKVMENGEDQ